MKSYYIASVLLLASGVSQAGVVLVGNPGSTDSLDMSTAKKLFLGKSKKLPNGQSVTLVELVKGNPVRAEFHQKVTGKTEAQLQSYWSRLVFTGKASPPEALASTALVKAKVASTPGAVGYLDESEVDGSVKVLLKP